MTEQRRMTVTLSWRDGDQLRTQQMACHDRAPQDLIPRLVERLGLPAVDVAGDTIFYRLRLDGEQGPALRPRELLSAQQVLDGRRLYLVSERANPEELSKRCLLRLPDGTEIVCPPRAQGLTRRWLLKFVELHNPEQYQREVEQIVRGRSPYQYVSNSPHCTIVPAERGGWLVTTDRTDVTTEWATDGEFDRVPYNIPQQLHNGARLRLGSSDGLQIAVILV